MPRVFSVTAHREGRWWVIDIPDVGAVAQASSWSTVRAEALGVAALMLDVDPARLRVGAVRRESRRAFDARL